MLLFLLEFWQSYKTPSLPFLVVDLFLKVSLHTPCIQASPPVEDTNPREIESMKLWKTLLSWVRETQARPEINIIELKKWKLEIHIPDIMIFLLKCIYRWPQSSHLHTLLKTLPNCRTSWRSVFLPLLCCTYNWYFCHLCLLLKLSMKRYFEMLDFVSSNIEL